MKLPSSPGSPKIALLGLLVTLTAAGGSASAAVQTFRYFEFQPTKLRSSTAIVQLSEFQFFNGSTAIPTAGVVVTDPGNNSPADQGPAQGFDGDPVTKWLDFAFGNSALIFDFGAPISIDSYNYITGGDASDRDPVSWTIQGSNDGSTWQILDTRTDAVPTGARSTVGYASNFVLPSSPPPSIVEFDFLDLSQPIIVKNGTTVSLYAATNLASSAVISSNTSATTYPVDPLDGTPVAVLPANDKDTTFTLTATNSATPPVSVTQSLLIRSVSGAPLSYQYVRYTPTKLRAGTSIQMSDFSFTSNGVKVPVTTVTNPGGQVQPGETIVSLIDDETTSGPTKWFSANIAPVIFDFGSVQTFDSYSFSTGNDSPERDPVQWYMEGSNDQTTWTLIENITDIVYPTTQSRNTASGTIPLPGTTAKPYVTLASDVTTVFSGQPATLTYTSVGAGSVSISPSVTTTGTSGTVAVSPTATTTYTITAVKAGNPAVTVTASITVNVVVPSGVVNFPDFSDSSQISLVGSAQILNDYATFFNAPNAKRLRLTPMLNGQAGSAWSVSKLKLSDGFETTFDASIANNTYYNGADGMAFIIQNTAAKYGAHPDNALQYNSNALTIALDSYPDQTGETNANLEIFSGLTLLVNANLSNGTTNGGAAPAGTPPFLSLARGYQGAYLVTGVDAAPYKVKVTYTPGSLSVSLDGTPVVTNLAVDLTAIGAVDTDGKGWVGFSGRTGGLNEFQDVVDWEVTPNSTTPSTPLAITSSVFTFGASPSVALTFSSVSGNTYKVTQSTDLVTWTTAVASVPATGPSTTTNVPFTAGTKGFFRVELNP